MGAALSKLVLPVVVLGFALAVYLLGRSTHHAGTKAGAALVSPIDQASLAASESNLQSADRDAQSYYVDHDFSYAGMTTDALKQYDATLSVVVAQTSATSYCLEAVVNGVVVAHQAGPNGVPFSGAC